MEHLVAPTAVLALHLPGESQGFFLACMAIFSLPTEARVCVCMGRRGWCLTLAAETQTPMHSLI